MKKYIYVANRALKFQGNIFDAGKELPGVKKLNSKGISELKQLVLDRKVRVYIKETKKGISIAPLRDKNNEFEKAIVCKDMLQEEIKDVKAEEPKAEEPKAEELETEIEAE